MFKASYSTNSVFLIQNGLFKLKKGKVEVLETKNERMKEKNICNNFGTIN
jgi:hypothetical protein